MSISIKLNESLNVEIDDLSFLYFSWNKHSSNEHKASHKSHEEYRPTGYCDWHHKPVCKKKQNRMWKRCWRFYRICTFQTTVMYENTIVIYASFGLVSIFCWFILQCFIFFNCYFLVNDLSFNKKRNTMSWMNL